MALNSRERAFVTAYLGRARGNATRAARLAGYSQRTSRQQGSRLLSKAAIRKQITQREQNRDKEAIADADERDELLSQIARSSLVPIKDRIRAVAELNKVSGRHSMTHVLKGRLTLEQALGASRTV
jgi:phage terminase small subunit